MLAVCRVCCDAGLFADRVPVAWLEDCPLGPSSGPGVGLVVRFECVRFRRV